MHVRLRTPSRVDVVRREPDGSDRVVVTARLAGDRAVLVGAAGDVGEVMDTVVAHADSRPEDGVAFLLALSAAYPASLAAAYGSWVAVPRGQP